jgi:hypothetical protein
MLSGAMAFGSLYSGYLNHPDIPIETGFIALTLSTLLYIFTGYYSFNYLAFAKGKLNIALVLNFVLLLLTSMAFSQGYNTSTQKWFSMHEVLNLILPMILTIQLSKIRFFKNNF